MTSPPTSKTALAYKEAYLRSTEDHEHPQSEGQEGMGGCPEQPGVLFHQAAIYSNPSLLMEILRGSQRRFINVRDKHGRTALHAACLADQIETEGSIECVKLLLETGADPNIAASEDSHNRTPLHVAAWSGQYAIANELLRYGADLDVKDSLKKTPLQLAEENEDLRMVECFMHKIEERAILRLELELPLLEACTDVEKLLPLLQKVGFTAINCDYKETLLYRATSLQKEDVVDFLISRGAEGKPNRDTKTTPLHLACIRGYYRVAQKLLQRFPSMAGQLNNDNELPLHWAAKQGNCKMVRYLLNFDYKGAMEQNEEFQLSEPSAARSSGSSFKSYKGDLPFYLNQRNINSQTALYLACAAGHLDVVEELLDYQPLSGDTGSLLPNGNLKPAFDVDTYTVEGLTPLHCAVVSGYLEIASALLRHGADVSLPVKSIHELMTTASSKDGADSCFKEAMHISSTDLSVLYAAFQRSECSLEMLKLLLCYGAKDVGGNTLLSANLARNHEVVSVLLAYLGVHRDQDSTINEACREKFRQLLLPLVTLKPTKKISSPSGSFGKSLKRKSSDDQKTSIIRRRKTLASIKRPPVTHASFDTPVTINWHDQNLTDINKEWLVEASLRFNPALKHIDSISNCIHDKVAVITRLDISDNCLRKVPLIIFQLPSLQMMNLSNNKLVDLPVGSPESIVQGESEPHIVGWKLPLLKELKLDGNRIRTVPLDVFKLPVLEVLTLVGNAIRELPFDMWRSPSLKVLNLSRNELKELPSSLADTDDVFQQDLGASMDTVAMDYSLPTGEGGHTPEDSETESNYLPMDQDSYMDMHPHTSLKGTGSTGGDAAARSRTGSVSVSTLKRHQLCSTGSVVSMAIQEAPIRGDEVCQLRELDLSHNLFEEVPQGLACRAPQLAKLNLSHNAIKNCGPINRFPAGLVDLYMSNNQVNHITNSTRKQSCPNGKHNKFMIFRGVYHSEDSNGGVGVCYSPYVVQSSSTPSLASKHISPESTLLIPTSPKLSPTGNKSYYCQHQRHRVLANLVTLDLSQNKLSALNFAVSSPATSPSPLDSKEDLFSAGVRDEAGKSDSKTGGHSPEIPNSEIYLLFPSLKVLAVSNNNLSVIPADIHHLTRLNSLKVDGNEQIREFPPEMGRLKNLLQLEFDGCPVREDFSRDMRVSDILSYLDSILEDAKPYNRMKLMFVGKCDIGKTTLLNELRKENAVFGRHHSELLSFAERTGSPKIGSKTLKGNYLSTVGVDVGEWNYCKKRGGKKITFSTWDFGGQNEFYVTHQYFLTKRSIYLVIFKITDGRKCLSELQQWLVNIQARAPNSPVILVGTHYDVLNQNKKYSREFWPELKKLIEDRFVVDSPQDMGLPNVQCCIEISCTAAGRYHNLSYLREKIYDVAFSMKDTKRGKDKETLLEKKIPTSYLALEGAIRTIVANMKKAEREPVMNTTEYKTEVARVMVDESEVSFHNNEELMLATKFLHNNGVLLYYEDALLSDYFFLDPQWLCDTLAKIVTIPEINPEAKKGIMKISDLEQKFAVRSNVNAFIRSLLNKFEVAVEYDNRHLLIPALLPNRQDAIKIPMIREHTDTVSETTSRQDSICITSGSFSGTPSTPECQTAAHGSTHWSRRAVRLTRQSARAPSKADRALPPGLGVAGNRYSSPAIMLSDGVDQPSLSKDDNGILLDSKPLGKSNSDQTIGSSHEWTKISQMDISLLTIQNEKPKVVEKSALDEFEITTCKLRKLPLRRLYVFQYIPSGFWSHIMCRFLSNERLMQVTRSMFEPRREVREFLGGEAVGELGGRYQWHCWQTGLELRFFDTTIFHIRQVSDTIINSFDKERRPDLIYMVNMSATNDLNPSEVSLMRNGQVEILIPNQAVQISRKQDAGGSKYRRERVVRMEKSTEHVSQLLSLIMDLIEMLLDNFYPALCEPLGTTFNGELFITRVVPCCKCWKEYNRTLCDDVNDEEWVFVNGSVGSGSQYFLEDDDSMIMGSFHRRRTRPTTCCPIPCVNTPRQKKYTEFGVQNGIPLERANAKRGNKVLLDERESSSVPINSALEVTGESDLIPLAKSLDTMEDRSIENSMEENHFSASEEILAECSVKVYGFLLEELIYDGMRSQMINCPSHGDIPITTLAPDVVFHDLGSSLLVDDAHIDKKRLLGRGSFGLVFEGKVSSDDGSTKAVALKMLQPYPPGEGARKTDRHRYEMENSKWQRFPVRFACEAYRTARKELSIMMRLSHPNIVPLEGMCRYPLCLILELAPLGALDNSLEDYKRGGARLTATTITAIVIQISSAVDYLHRNQIIYRDLKADNVLVWKFPDPHSSELEPNDLKVKLADYGVSTTALPTGTKGFGGTPGYMAPEIVKYDGKETYTEKVDCFSFGMFMYELLSLQRPFDSVIDQGVGRLAQIIKHYIIEGQRPILSHKEKAYPTYILDLMLWCWAQEPRERPTMAQVNEVAQMAEFTALMDVFSLKQDVSAIRDACVLEVSYEEASTSVLCMAQTLEGASRVSLFPLERSPGDEFSSLQFNISDSLVQCMCAVGDMLWLALASGYIKIYNGDSCQEVYEYHCHQSHSKNHTITCMRYITPLQMVAIAADNQLILQRVSEVGLPVEEPGSFQYAELGKEITALTVTSSNESSFQIWCGHEGGEVTVLEADNLSAPVVALSHFTDGNLVACVEHLVTDTASPVNQVWSSVSPNAVVYQWNVRTRRIEAEIAIPEIMRQRCGERYSKLMKHFRRSSGVTSFQVASLYLQNQILYVGIKCGLLILIDTTTRSALHVMNCHQGPMEFILGFPRDDYPDSRPLVATDEMENSVRRSPTESGLVTIGKRFADIFSSYDKAPMRLHESERDAFFLLLWNTQPWELDRHLEKKESEC